MRKQGNGVRRLLPYLKPYSKALLAGIVLIVACTVLSAAAPRIEGLITTRLMENAAQIEQGTAQAGVDFGYIGRVIAVLATIYLLNAGANCLSSFLLTDAVQHAMRDLREAVQQKIHRMPVRYFDAHAFGDVLSRVVNDVETIANALQQSLGQLVNSALTLVFALAMMFIIHPVLALVALLILPAAYLCARFVVSRSQKLFVAQQQSLGRLNGMVQEQYTGFVEVKLYGAQEKSARDFGAANEQLCKNGMRAQFISGLMGPMIAFITYIGIGAVGIMGAGFALRGALTVGDLQAFIRYVWQVNQPLSQMTQLSAAIQSAMAAVQRVFEFLDEEEEIPDAQPATQLAKVRGDVAFEHVRFGYEQDKPLIGDLSVSVKSGQMVAIVGPTGAGKTTLVNLLMRFYDVDGGCIRVDGVDIRDMKRWDLRSLLGMVLQDTWLFGGTIRDNLAYGCEGVDDEQIMEAAKAANVHHFIKTLPDGYHMRINEEASNISQGEKQLLTIARAFLADPPILILDEATSSVDTRLELLLQKAMQRIMAGRTSFVIAHRLSTIRNADLILVMNGGEIIEQGTHEELMARSGFYSQLYNSQFAHLSA